MIITFKYAFNVLSVSFNLTVACSPCHAETPQGVTIITITTSIRHQLPRLTPLDSTYINPLFIKTNQTIELLLAESEEWKMILLPQILSWCVCFDWDSTFYSQNNMQSCASTFTSSVLPKDIRKTSKQKWSEESPQR